jgi:hypothetical protein
MSTLFDLAQRLCQGDSPPPVARRALRTCTTQEDAQRLAELIEQAPWAVEVFHQAYPPTSTGILATGFWEDPTIFTLPSGSACFGEQL